MLNTIKESLWTQFGASIDMLKNAITAYPEDHWDHNRKFFYIAYHTLVFLDYYVDADGDDIKVTVVTPDGTIKQMAAKYHTALTFADGTAFVPNSPYYLLVLPQAEEQNNPNLNN